MYSVIIDEVGKAQRKEDFDDFFMAKERAKFLYLQGSGVQILKGEKPLMIFLHMYEREAK